MGALIRSKSLFAVVVSNQCFLCIPPQITTWARPQTLWCGRRYRASQQASVNSNAKQASAPLHPPHGPGQGPLSAFTLHVQQQQQQQTCHLQQGEDSMEVDGPTLPAAEDGVQGQGAIWGHSISSAQPSTPLSGGANGGYAHRGTVNGGHLQGGYANGLGGAGGQLLGVGIQQEGGQQRINGVAMDGCQGPQSAQDPSRSADEDDCHPGPLPMLASACPGWVCYAEKAHGDLVLPHIAAAKSPQAVMGSLVKRLMAHRLGVTHPSSIYHCSVMPCYDKKLEASRDELTVPGTEGPQKVPEVDNCLTTGELHKLLEQHGVQHLSQVPQTRPPNAIVEPHLGHHQQQQEAVEDGRLYGLPGGSGGYMDFVIRTAALELFGRSFPPGPLPIRTLRNSDFQEVLLEDEAGKVLLRCAIANGFRNIQTIVRKMKMRRCEYHYVEVMACPSGCLAGGGQLKPSPDQTPQQMLEQLELAYHHQDVIPRHPADNPAVQQLYCSRVPGGPGSHAARALLHTSYRKRESTVASAATVSDW
ncbi:iron hydrogenase [Dunaliella salina]|uniref:Iron hydrogenase n=1 Tax=Dunaliella salina TaxID=3046 RepID=A0ABQ7GX47_DUNSA|nr:iron hydrogenase [Dunaliella salina]|eukprot:KAF5839180.1 iron hydrogenase [Dunaliella salina]